MTPELRGDIMMARKMYREAIDFYKPGAEKSAILANKTGIAYHQLQDLNNAEKYYQARGQAEFRSMPKPSTTWEPCTTRRNPTGAR